MTPPAPGIELRIRDDGSKAYRATVFDKRTGKRHRKTFDKLAHAKRWKADAERQLRAGAKLSSTGPTLNQAWEEWHTLARKGVIRNRSGDPYKAAALRGYATAMKHRILPEFGHWRLNEIQRPDVQAHVERLAVEGHAPSTIDTALNPVRRIYRRAMGLGLVQHNPCASVEVPSIIRRPSWIPDAILCLDLLDALEPADRPVWATAMFAGLRRGEMVGLRTEDVDLAQGLIHIRRGWDDLDGEILPKSRAGARKVPIVALLRDYLVDHAARVGETRPGHFLGHLNDLRPLYERSHETWTEAGLRTVTFHDCRHAAASFFIAAGGNPKAISTILGHASINTTFDLYGHLFPGAEDELGKLADGYFAARLAEREGAQA